MYKSKVLLENIFFFFLEANYIWYENNERKDRFGKYIKNIHHNYYVWFDINASLMLILN